MLPPPPPAEQRALYQELERAATRGLDFDDADDDSSSAHSESFSGWSSGNLDPAERGLFVPPERERRPSAGELERERHPSTSALTRAWGSSSSLRGFNPQPPPLRLPSANPSRVASDLLSRIGHTRPSTAAEPPLHPHSRSLNALSALSDPTSPTAASAATDFTDFTDFTTATATREPHSATIALPFDAGLSLSAAAIPLRPHEPQETSNHNPSRAALPSPSTSAPHPVNSDSMHKGITGSGITPFSTEYSVLPWQHTSGRPPARAPPLALAPRADGWQQQSRDEQPPRPLLHCGRIYPALLPRPSTTGGEPGTWRVGDRPVRDAGSLLALTTAFL